MTEEQGKKKLWVCVDVAYIAVLTVLTMVQSRTIVYQQKTIELLRAERDRLEPAKVETKVPIPSTPFFPSELTAPTLIRFDSSEPVRSPEEMQWLKRASGFFTRLEKAGTIKPVIRDTLEYWLEYDTANELLQVSRACLDQNDYETAQEACDIVIAWSPKHIRALELSGDIYVAQKQNEKAREQYAKCIEALERQRRDNGDLFLDRTGKRLERSLNDQLKKVREKLDKLPK